MLIAYERSGGAGSVKASENWILCTRGRPSITFIFRHHHHHIRHHCRRHHDLHHHRRHHMYHQCAQSRGEV